MKVLVTGAAGLLGSHVAELALERGDAVHVPGLIYWPRDTNSFRRFARLVEQGNMVIIVSSNTSRSEPLTLEKERYIWRY